MPYGVTESQPAVAESRIIGRDDVTRRQGGGCPLSSAIGISRAVSTADRAVSAGPCAGEQSYRVCGCIITVKPSLSARRARYIYILKGPIRHAEFAYRFYVHPDRRIYARLFRQDWTYMLLDRNLEKKWSEPPKTARKSHIIPGKKS